VVCVTAAGNEGHDGNPATSHLIAPADALEVLTCGAVDAGGSIAWFSSDGPTADGRLKPELLARGVDTFTVSSSNNSGLAQVSGTSLSTPLVAAGVACLLPRVRCSTVAEIRGMLFASAGRSGDADPLGVLGYGILNAASAVPADSGACDFNSDGFLDFFDYDDFVACFEGGACPCGRTADFNGDDFVDFFDYDAFVEAFQAGC
jgi:subtilisin family serine protease